MSSLARGSLVVKDVHKSFRIYHSRSVKDALVRLGSGRSLWDRREVLRGTSFEVQPGERVAIVGKNGAGKSTVFRLISRILRPDSGVVTPVGRVSPLIELTAGLVPDLSGSENLLINASVLGLTRKEISRRYDAIVEFAELGDFMETPVRYYSSGMRARLGFSIAVHVDADVVLIDEALAVGDVSFQERCIDRMRSIATAGASVVFVSHEMDHVRAFCDRVIWLDDGVARMDGTPDEVLQAMNQQGGAVPAPERPAMGENQLSASAERAKTT